MFSPCFPVYIQSLKLIIHLTTCNRLISNNRVIFSLKASSCISCISVLPFLFSHFALVFDKNWMVLRNRKAAFQIENISIFLFLRALALENSNATLFYNYKKPFYHYTIPFYNTSTSQTSTSLFYSLK